jgi:hypothetical protein
MKQLLLLRNEWLLTIFKRISNASCFLYVLIILRETAYVIWRRISLALGAGFECSAGKSIFWKNIAGPRYLID